MGMRCPWCAEHQCYCWMAEHVLDIFPLNPPEEAAGLSWKAKLVFSEVFSEYSLIAAGYLLKLGIQCVVPQGLLWNQGSHVGTEESF